MQNFPAYLIAGAIALGSAIVACSEDRPPSGGGATRTQTEDAAAAEGGTSNPGADAGKTLAVCSDAQALAIDLALNQGEIDVAQAVLPRLTTADLRAFAQLVISDHTKLRDAANAAAASTASGSEAAVTPQPNAISGTIQEGAQRAIAELASAADEDVGRAYLNREIISELSGLAVTEQLVVPSISKMSLAVAIAGGTPIIQTLEAVALQLQTAIEGVCGGQTTPPLEDAGTSNDDDSGNGDSSADGG